jgi:hypothetical protein
MVGPEDQDHLRVLVLDERQILAHRVGGAAEPIRAHRHLGRHHGDELIREQRGDGPGLADMFDQRLGLVLHQQIDGEDPRVDQVAQHEIDDPIARAERHRGL